MDPSMYQMTDNMEKQVCPFDVISKVLEII